MHSASLKAATSTFSSAQHRHLAHSRCFKALARHRILHHDSTRLPKSGDCFRRNKQQCSANSSPSDGVTSSHDLLEETQELVETAMLAAVSGLLYLVTATVGLDRYLGHFLPVPILVSAVKRGKAACWWTTFVTSCLIAVLLGPLRALTYMLAHGIPSAVFGTCWANKSNKWQTSIVCVAVVKMLSQILSLVLASVTMGENLLALTVSSVGMMLDKAGMMLGSSASSVVSSQAILVVMAFLLLLNCLVYTALSHVLYYLVLKGMKFDVPEAPALVVQAINGQSNASTA